ncbi:hypothetical protein INS49_014352 [Diaporthe citri]|uniref:uncharacterized protein n=1 Tax=Diaporthe citri TaxID=83186 RepID=UPI001C826CCA|nr:uncharacterized protein INS49_014352 [Diaporthe citri]KAG6358468.1 hypothetical protein INS49_014352 [Diaporthe citri]
MVGIFWKWCSYVDDELEHVREIRVDALLSLVRTPTSKSAAYPEGGHYNHSETDAYPNGLRKPPHPTGFSIPIPEDPGAPISRGQTTHSKRQTPSAPAHMTAPRVPTRPSGRSSPE